jgi:hypothetical protein
LNREDAWRESDGLASTDYNPALDLEKIKSQAVLDRVLDDQINSPEFTGKRPEWTALTIGMGHFSVQMVTLDQVR